MPINLHDFIYLHSDNFRIYLENSSSLNEKTLELLETVYDRYVQLMAKEGYVLRNADSFVWLCFENRQSYEAYSARADGFIPNRLNSYYSAKTNCVAILTDPQGDFPLRRSSQRLKDPHQISGSDFSGGQELSSVEVYNPACDENGFTQAMITHELIHQLSFNFGLQKRGVEYPLWVSEGIATGFEYIFEDSLNKDHQYRLKTILRLNQQDRLIPLETFVSMTRLSRPELTDSETYAQCWAFFDFLWKYRKPQLKHYLVKTGLHPAGPISNTLLKQEFMDCFGPLERMESDWKTWLESQNSLQ